MAEDRIALQLALAESALEGEMEAPSVTLDGRTVPLQRSTLSRMAAEAPEIPHEVFCSICKEVMSEDPVVARDGFTYHRVCIMRWFEKGKRTSPRTNATLESMVLTPNIDMRNLIQEMLKWMPEGRPPAYDERSYTITDAEDPGDSQGAVPSPLGPVDDANAQQVQPSLWAMSSYTVTVVTGPANLQEYTFLLTEVDSGDTAAVVASLVAERLNTHVSRLRLQCGDVDVNVLSTLPNGSEIKVTIAEHDWQDIVNLLPDNKKKQYFLDLAGEPHPDDPDLRYCDTAEFSEILRLQCTLVNGWTTRGAQSASEESDEWAEFVSVLQEARVKPGATPASVLRFLQEEFC